MRRDRRSGHQIVLGYYARLEQCSLAWQFRKRKNFMV
jgi:hypothetical protein